MKVKPIKLSAPISAELLLTQQCNLECKHCIFECSPEKKQRLSKKEIFNIIDELAEMKVFTIGLNGGEPLLLKNELYEIIEYICKKGMSFLLTTNGILLDKDFISFLKEKDILCVRISLDSTNEQKHNEFRGRNFAFEKAMENAKECVRQGVETTLLVSLTYENLKEFDKIIDFGNQLGVDSLNFFPIMPHGRAKNLDKLILSQKEYKQFLEFFLKKRKEVSKPILLGDFPLENLLDKSILENKNIFGKTCPAGNLSFVINWEGKVFPCPLFPVEAGDIHKESLKEIWDNSPLLEEIRDTNKFKGKCKDCEHLNLCRGGCPARTYLKYKDLSKSDPLCWYNESK